MQPKRHPDSLLERARSTTFAEPLRARRSAASTFTDTLYLIVHRQRERRNVEGGFMSVLRIWPGGRVY